MRFREEVSIFSKDSIAKQVKTFETDFKVLSGKISSVISESEITTLRNGKKTMYSRLSSAEQTIKGMTRQYSEIKQDLDSVSMKQTSIIENIDGISTIVSSKVGEDEIISKINQSAEGITIDASKLNINAEDVRLRASKLSWSSDYSNLSADGSLFVRRITAIGGSIAGWDIKRDEISKNIGDKFVALRPGTNEAGDVLVIKDGTDTPFYLHSDGYFKAERGKIAGWHISKDALIAENGAYGARIGMVREENGFFPVFQVFNRAPDELLWSVDCYGQMHSNAFAEFQKNVVFNTAKFNRITVDYKGEYLNILEVIRRMVNGG